MGACSEVGQGPRWPGVLVGNSAQTKARPASCWLQDGQTPLSAFAQSVSDRTPSRTAPRRTTYVVLCRRQYHRRTSAPEQPRAPPFSSTSLDEGTTRRLGKTHNRGEVVLALLAFLLRHNAECIFVLTPSGTSLVTNSSKQNKKKTRKTKGNICWYFGYS